MIQALLDWITAIGTVIGALATLVIAVISIRRFPENVARAIRSNSHLPQPLRDDPFMLNIYNILTKNNIHVEYDRHGVTERCHASDNIVPLPYHKLPSPLQQYVGVVVGKPRQRERTRTKLTATLFFPKEPATLPRKLLNSLPITTSTTNTSAVKNSTTAAPTNPYLPAKSKSTIQ